MNCITAVEKHPHFNGMFCYMNGQSEVCGDNFRMTGFKTKFIPPGRISSASY